MECLWSVFYLEDPSQVQGLVLLQDEVGNLVTGLGRGLDLLQHLPGSCGLLLLACHNLLLLLYLQLSFHTTSLIHACRNTWVVG